MGRGFESFSDHQYTRLVQRLEPRAHNAFVGSSNLSPSTNIMEKNVLQDKEEPLIEKDSKEERIRKSEFARARRRGKKDILNGVTERRYAKNRKARKNK